MDELVWVGFEQQAQSPGVVAVGFRRDTIPSAQEFILGIQDRDTLRLWAVTGLEERYRLIKIRAHLPCPAPEVVIVSDRRGQFRPEIDLLVG